MIITLQKENIPESLRTRLGVEGWRGPLELNLTRLKPDIVDKLEAALKEEKSARGFTKALGVIAAFRKMKDLKPDDACLKAKLPKLYYPAFISVLKTQLPGFRVYDMETEGNGFDAYYVERIAFSDRRKIVHKASEGGERWTEQIPARITLCLVYIDETGLQRHEVGIGEENFMHKHPLVALNTRGLTLETPALKATMLAERSRWNTLRSAIGHQLRATGSALAYIESEDDGNTQWWRSKTKQVVLDRDGPAPLVVDVRTEEKSDEDDEENGTLKLNSFTTSFWTKSLATPEEEKLFKAGDDDDDEAADEDEDDDSYLDDDEAETVNATPEGTGFEASSDQERVFGALSEVPCHPWLRCFDLRKHHRVRVHMRQTSDYVYDVGMRNKLVISTESRLLIEMLLHQRAQFQDIVAKKGGGAVILCAGPPGVGKTLTSEVFAESEKRPLYSVQCSQLGTSADELEASLLKIFGRAQRWNAILLLDEADVYIAKRGSDMNQNAIVGVFLRVLEYYNGVMFMTTNRAESVDDAVLSRCVARIDYANPDKAEQVSIWHILAKQSGLAIAPGAAENIAERFSLSGRDVKQILKLAGLVAYARKLTEIDVKTIEFCMRFKPTEKIKA